MKILIDNGHGVDTPGKRSTDKRLLEYKYTREIAARVVMKLQEKGYDAERIVMEAEDISLATRCRRVNNYCNSLGKENVCLVSIHVNAASRDGKWHDASGFSAHVAMKSSERSKRLARMLWEEAIEKGLRGNRSIPAEKYKPQNLAMCRDTKCAAVLTENMFMDNKKDVDFLLSEEGRTAVVNTHVDAIIKYVRSCEG